MRSVFFFFFLLSLSTLLALILIPFIKNVAFSIHFSLVLELVFKFSFLLSKKLQNLYSLLMYRELVVQWSNMDSSK